MLSKRFIVVMAVAAITLSIIIYGKNIKNAICSSENNDPLRNTQQTENAKSINGNADANSGNIRSNTLNKKSNFDAHESLTKYHFNDNDMDFTFGSLVLGSAVNKGVEIGEAFYVASKITDGDVTSWQHEWKKMADRAEARGQESLVSGHNVSARDQFQRASYYNRIALLGILPDDVRLKEIAEKSRYLLKKAGGLFSPPLEYVEISFENTMLPIYFRKASKDNNPRKTLIMLGGGETFAEDLFFYISQQAFDRGYNFVTADLPGQGLLPLKGKFFRPDMYVPIKAVVDYVLSRPDVDPKYLAIYGYSGGGGFAPQAASHDNRIKAVIMNSCVVDAEKLFATMPAVKATSKDMASWSTYHLNTVKLIAWRWGVAMDNPAGLVAANRGFTFDPTKISVPALIIVGEGEYKSDEVKRQQKICLNGFSNQNKKMVITPKNEGASNHCIMENRSIVGQTVFDWLDVVFKKT